MANVKPKQAQINFTRFSMSRELIESAFLNKISFTPQDSTREETISENRDIQICEKCDYKTSKDERMREHILVRHSERKHKCAECDYQHHFANRVRSHFKQVHMGIPRKNEKCKSTQCLNFGTAVCLWLEDHGLFQCEQCNFTAKRQDQLKIHVDSVHEGILFSFKQSEFSAKSKHTMNTHNQSVHEGIVFQCKQIPIKP